MKSSDNHIVSALGNEAHVFQEAWLNRFGISRFVRFVLTIAISFFAATAFVQESNRTQCENGKHFVRSYANFVSAATESRTQEAKVTTNAQIKKNDLETAAAYRAQLKLLKPGLTKSCASQYPIIPGLDK